MNRNLRALIYIYFFFIIYDGIFRKWLLPQFSDVIMMIKSAIAVLIFIGGLHYVKKFSLWEFWAMALGVLTFLFTMTGGHGNVGVALYGVFPLIIGFPVCFIIGHVLRKKDLNLLGKIITYTLIINCIFIAIQFTLPASHWINYQGFQQSAEVMNRTAGELAGAIRPSGIFMHSTHNIAFSALGFVFVLYFYFINTKVIGKFWLNIALVLEATSVIFSVSRTNAMVHVAILIIYLLFLLNTKKRDRTLVYMLLLTPIFIIIMSTGGMKKAQNNFNKRFENAAQGQYRGSSTIQGTLNDIQSRAITYNINALLDPRDFKGNKPPTFGWGQGLGTQVGGRLLELQTYSGFAVAEWDGLRIMCESGILMGWMIIFVRLGYSWRFLLHFYRFKRNRQFLSITLLPVFILLFYLTSTWGNVFTCNFAFLTAGMFLSSLKIKES